VSFTVYRTNFIIIHFQVFSDAISVDDDTHEQYKKNSFEEQLLSYVKVCYLYFISTVKF